MRKLAKKCENYASKYGTSSFLCLFNFEDELLGKNYNTRLNIIEFFHHIKFHNSNQRVYMTHTVFTCMSPFSTTVFLILNVDNYLSRFLMLHNKNYQASRTFTSLSHKRVSSSFYRLLVQLLLLPSLSYYKMYTPNNSFVFYGQCTTFCISGSLL